MLYRGQADKVKERLESHLCNRQYKTRLKGKEWERCLKLDEVATNKGGITIDEIPFGATKWVVIILSMPDSTSEMRVLTEWGFDEVWGKPVACNETKKNTHNINEVLVDARDISSS